MTGDSFNGSHWPSAESRTAWWNPRFCANERRGMSDPSFLGVTFSLYVNDCGVKYFWSDVSLVRLVERFLRDRARIFDGKGAEDVGCWGRDPEFDKDARNWMFLDPSRDSCAPEPTKKTGWPTRNCIFFPAWEKMYAKDHHHISDDGIITLLKDRV